MRFLQSESELSDETKRLELDAVVTEARTNLIKTLNLPPSTADNDSKLRNLTPPFKEQWRAKVKEMLIDEEVRRRKYV